MVGNHSPVWRWVQAWRKVTSSLVAQGEAFVATRLDIRMPRRTLDLMTIHRSKTETAIWGLLAFAGGCAVGWADAHATNAQGPALVLMLLAFALTLPGRAPVILVAVASATALPAVHAVLGGFGNSNLGDLLILIPAFIGAGGGRLAGSLLDTAARRLAEASAQSDTRWIERPVTTRFILAVALVVIAVAGLPSATAALRGINHVAPSWVAMVWEIMTLLGWIGLTPLLLADRPLAWRATRGGATGLTPADVATHLLLVGILSALHAAIIVALSGLLFIPLTPDWHTLALTAFTIYVPLDLLAYLSILTLGFASDVARQRRDQAQREAALQSESLNSRLAALRARLNPHFLFNALNSVHVLARAGKTEETTDVVEGLTSLLRYVLDERRPAVPLNEELEFVRRYLAVQQVRFGARLRYAIECEPSVGDASVPQLLLQPLVENAVEHGVSRALGGGEVHVTAARIGDMLRLTIDDDGPGPSGAESPAGIGLASTRERLGRLYDDRARLLLEPRLTGGTRVTIDLPFTVAQRGE
jgi:two-component system LytT family sensor kinase